MTNVAATSEDVTRLLGDLNDHKVLEILATGASLQDLEEASAWLHRESDVMGEQRKPLAGRVAQVYEIAAREEEWVEQEEAASR